jgi:hypothetical protein
MTASNRLFAITVICAALLAPSSYESAIAQTISVKPEYLMTIYLDLKESFATGSVRIVDIPGGWVEGPRIKGKIIPPSGDWFRPLASGIGRIGVRLIVQTDDNEIIYVSYNGIQQCSKESDDKLSRGELLKTDDCYFIVAPTFETTSERYGWLNAVQAVGKMTELRRGSHIKYEFFMIK